MKREYRDHQGREWFALHVRTGEERDVALAVYGLGDADSLLPVEHYTTRGQERERILMPGYVFVGCVMNADMWQRLRHLRGVLRILGEPYEAIPEEQMTAVMALYWHGVQGTQVVRQNGVTEVVGGPLLEVTHTITCADARQGVITVALGRALCEDDEMLHIIPASHGALDAALDLPGGMREVTMHATFRPEAGGTSEENFI